MENEIFKQAVRDEMAARYPEAKVVVDDPTCFEHVCDRIAETHTAYRKEGPDDAEFFTDFGRVRGHIVPVLVSCEGNEEFLGGVPYRRWLDMALVLQARYDTGGGNTANIWITNEHARIWGAPKNILFETAMENAVRDSPPVLKDLGEVLAGPAGDEQAGLTGGGHAQTTPMLVLSNRELFYGAAVLAYPGEVDKLVTRFPKGFYMLPSSIHELIIVPVEDGGKSLPAYTRMVQEVNFTSVDPGEQLSDHAYYYDAEGEGFVF